jgi:hypothetical protein
MRGSQRGEGTGTGKVRSRSAPCTVAPGGSRPSDRIISHDRGRAPFASCSAQHLYEWCAQAQAARTTAGHPDELRRGLTMAHRAAMATIEGFGP